MPSVIPDGGGGLAVGFLTGAGPPLANPAYPLMPSNALPFILHAYTNAWAFKGTSAVLNKPQIQSNLNAGLQPIKLEVATPLVFNGNPLVPGDLILLAEQDISRTSGDITVFGGTVEDLPDIMSLSGTKHEIAITPFVSELGDTPFYATYSTPTDVARIVHDAISNCAHVSGNFYTMTPQTGVKVIAQFSTTVLDCVDQCRKMAGSTYWYFVDEIARFWFQALGSGPTSLLLGGQNGQAGSGYTATQADLEQVVTSQDLASMRNEILVVGGIAPLKSQPTYAVYGPTQAQNVYPYAGAPTALDTTYTPQQSATISTVGRRRWDPPLTYPGIYDQNTITQIANQMGNLFDRVRKNADIDLPNYKYRVRMGQQGGPMIRYILPTTWQQQESESGSQYNTPVGLQAVSATNAGPSLTLTFPALTGTSNALVAWIHAVGAGAAISTAPAGWSHGPIATMSGGNVAQMWYQVNTPGNQTQFKWTGGGTNFYGIVAEYANVATADSSNSATGTGATASVATAASISNELLVAGFTNDAANTWTAGGSYSKDTNSTTQATLTTLNITNGPGQQTATATQGSSVVWAAGMVTLKASTLGTTFGAYSYPQVVLENRSDRPRQCLKLGDLPYSGTADYEWEIVRLIQRNSMFANVYGPQALTQAGAGGNIQTNYQGNTTVTDASGYNRLQWGQLASLTDPSGVTSPAEYGIRTLDASGNIIFDTVGIAKVALSLQSFTFGTSGNIPLGTSGSYQTIGSTTTGSFTLARRAKILALAQFSISTTNFVVLGAGAPTTYSGNPGIRLNVGGQVGQAAYFFETNATPGALSIPTTFLTVFAIVTLPGGTYTASLEVNDSYTAGANPGTTWALTTGDIEVIQLGG